MNTPDTLGKRLKVARQSIAASQNDIGAAIGRHKNTICRYENDIRVPDADDTQKLCTALNISPDWLLSGKGEMRPSTHDDRPKPTTTYDVPREPEVFPVVYEAQDDEGLINVPLVAARLSAGVGSLQVESDVESYFAFSSAFLHRKGNPQAMVVMRVEGDSMSPEIRDKDMVLIDQSKTEIRLGRIFAVGFEDSIYLKRIDKEPGKLLLKSVNPAYSPVEITLGGQLAGSFRVIGEVLWVGREY